MRTSADRRGHRRHRVEPGSGGMGGAGGVPPPCAAADRARLRLGMDVGPIRPRQRIPRHGPATGGRCHGHARWTRPEPSHPAIEIGSRRPHRQPGARAAGVADGRGTDRARQPRTRRLRESAARLGQPAGSHARRVPGGRRARARRRYRGPDRRGRRRREQRPTTSCRRPSKRPPTATPHSPSSGPTCRRSRSGSATCRRPRSDTPERGRRRAGPGGGPAGAVAAEVPRGAGRGDGVARQRGGRRWSASRTAPSSSSSAAADARTIASALLGSTGMQLLHHADCPVLDRPRRGRTAVAMTAAGHRRRCAAGRRREVSTRWPRTVASSRSGHPRRRPAGSGHALPRGLTGEPALAVLRPSQRGFAGRGGGPAAAEPAAIGTCPCSPTRPASSVGVASYERTRRRPPRRVRGLRATAHRGRGIGTLLLEHSPPGRARAASPS